MNRNHSFVRLRRKAKNNLDKNAITEKYIKSILIRLKPPTSYLRAYNIYSLK